MRDFLHLEETYGIRSKSTQGEAEKISESHCNSFAQFPFEIEL